MPVYKDGKSGWRVVYRYTDFRGELKQTQKRGFKTQREAKQWEHEQILKTEASLDMTFGSFVEIFAIDKQERTRKAHGRTRNISFARRFCPISRTGRSQRSSRAM